MGKGRGVRRLLRAQPIAVLGSLTNLVVSYGLVGSSLGILSASLLFPGISIVAVGAVVVAVLLSTRAQLTRTCKVVLGALITASLVGYSIAVIALNSSWRDTCRLHIPTFESHRASLTVDFFASEFRCRYETASQTFESEPISWRVSVQDGR